MFKSPVSILISTFFVLPLAVRAETPASPTDAVVDTVTVTAKKEAVVKKIDKTVFDVSNMPRAANGSAQDVLQSTPGISVTADGKISVKGNSQVTVLVDGKPTAGMSGDERAVALQTMGGTDIASVEVMTNPSAAYNANGGAILNIVLKRNRKPGAHAQIQGSASDQGLWNMASSADLTSDKLSVHGSLAFRHDGTQKFRQSTVGWTNPISAQTGQTQQSSDVFIHRTVKNAVLGIDYALSNTDSLSLSAGYKKRQSRPLFDVLNEDSTGADHTIFHRISNGPNEQSDHNASLSYSHQDNGTALKAMVQHSSTIGLFEKSYKDVFVTPALAPDYSHGTSKSARHLNQATLDWSRASDQEQWGMGLDVQKVVDDLYNYQASVDPLTGTETPDLNTTNGYGVTATLSALYLTDKITKGNWEVLLGARAERMALEISPTQNLIQTHLQAINPSVHLRYAASDQADFTFSFRRSLQRPDPRDLSPFTTYVDAQNLSRGNPNLKPQILNSWEIGTNLEQKNLSGDLGVFYRTSSDTVVDARSFDDKVLLTSKQNGGQARSFGITGSLNWKRNAALDLGMDGGVYRVMLNTPDLASIVTQEGVSAYANFKAAYSVGDDDVSLDAHIQSSGITPLGKYGPTSSINLSWKHRLNKTLSLTLNASDIFDGSKRTYETDTSTFHQRGYDHFVARRLYVGFVKKIE